MPRTIVKKMSHPDPLPDPARVTLRRRIEWIDTDAAGIYHWTTAFRLAEAAEAALHTALGIADQTFGATPRVGVAPDFRRSLRFNDAVDVELAVDGVRTAEAWRFGCADGAGVGQPVAGGDVQRHVRGHAHSPRGAAGSLLPGAGGMRVADQSQLGALDGQTRARVGGSDELPDRVARAGVPALDAVAARGRFPRAQPLDVCAGEPPAGQLDRPERGRSWLCEPGGLDGFGALAVLDLHPVAELAEELGPRLAEAPLQSAGAEFGREALDVGRREEELGCGSGEVRRAGQPLPVRRADDRGVTQPVGGS